MLSNTAAWSDLVLETGYFEKWIGRERGRSRDAKKWVATVLKVRMIMTWAGIVGVDY